jgi:hypothetical protein
MHLMAGTLSGLRKRLAKVEQQMADRADRARRALLAKCNCEDWTIALSPEAFEAAMNLRCLCHGFRRLGKITRLPVKPDSPPTRMDELIATYEARLAQADSEQAHDP